MKKQKGFVRISTIISITFLIFIAVICFKQFKKNYFNGFQKAVSADLKQTTFIRDSEVTYSKNDSYKIESKDFNDATFYKEIEVEPNTMYKLSCMVKTENVKNEINTEDGGATIGILESVEYSKPIDGTNDWQLVEFMFNSKNRDKVKLSFRLGGNQNNSTGTVWFSDFKLEKGTSNVDYKWNIGCFIINELNVNIEGKQYKFNINSEDVDNVKLNLERYKTDCYEFSNNKMDINYEIIEIDKPITTISYSDEHGYYLSYKDVSDAIYDIVRQKEYDHIFIVCRMEDEQGKQSIPRNDNWIGLGSMDFYGIGYSVVRINKNSNSYTYKYGITNQTPEEVYLHEFLHTLERNVYENGYEIPALHDYAQYGYTEKTVEGLKDWYVDYMSKKIWDENAGTYIGLTEFAYRTQPPNSTNFKYTVEIDFNHEPQNLFEEILTVFDALKKRKEK